MEQLAVFSNREHGCFEMAFSTEKQSANYAKAFHFVKHNDEKSYFEIFRKQCLVTNSFERYESYGFVENWVFHK